MTDTPTVRSAETVPVWAAESTPATREDAFPWWVLLVLGIISIVFGLVMVAWPDVTLRVTAAFVGIWLLVAGIARILGAFISGRGFGAQVLSGIIGVLLVVAGVACLRNIVTSLAVLATIVSLTWLFSGLSELVMAFVAHGSARVWLFALGGVSTLVGLVLVMWPALSLVTLVLTMSVSAIVVGAAQVMSAFQLRKLLNAA